MIRKNKVRLVITIDKDKLQEVKRRASSVNSTMSDHLLENTLKSYYFVLTEDISLRIDYISEVKVGSELWRINVEFLEAKTENWLRDIWYEIWVSQEYVEDEFRMDRSPVSRDLADFAFRFIEKRYKENKKELPKEFGAFITKKTKIILTKNRNELVYLFEKNNSSY